MGTNYLILWISIILCGAAIWCINSICSFQYRIKEMELNKKLELEKLRKDEKLEIFKLEAEKQAANDEFNKLVKHFNEIVTNELKDSLTERQKAMKQ